MFRAKTMEDFVFTQETVQKMNDQEYSPWDIQIMVKTTEDDCRLEIIDQNELLYYGGPGFNSAIDELTHALILDTKDDKAYFDCVSPGRWIADFKNSSRYDEECLQYNLLSGFYESVTAYMKDNEASPEWNETQKQRFKEIEKELQLLALDLFHIDHERLVED